MKPVSTGLILIVLMVLSHQSGRSDTLLDRETFDRITLDAANGNFELDVYPVVFDGGLPPSPLPQKGGLRVRPLKVPEREYVVRWTNIARYQTYLDLVHAEAEELLNANRFDEAYRSIEYLRRQNLPEEVLRKLIGNYLYRHASYSFKQRDFRESLAVIQSLYDYQPDRPGLEKAIARIAEEWIDSSVETEDYGQLRQALQSLEQSFPTLDLPVIKQWNQKLDLAAKEFLNTARRRLLALDFEGARVALRQALDIRPALKDLLDVGQQIDAADPRIVVGVYEPLNDDFSIGLDDWAGRRGTALLHRPICELTGYAAAGGQYTTPLGNIALQERGTRLIFNLDPQVLQRAGWTAASVTRRMTQLADFRSPFFLPDLAELLEQIDVIDPQTIQLTLRRPHVRPEALFRVSMFDPLAMASTSDSRVATKDSDETLQTESPATDSRFLISRTSGDVRRQEEGIARRDDEFTLIERVYATEDEAVEALRSGQIDVLDRVSPWMAAELAGDDAIRVGTYGLPTVHVLILRPDHPLLSIAEFRRGLSYAIDRERIVTDDLSSGTSIPGFVPLGGPFPLGRDLTDPLGYAYNRGQPARPCEPILAATLTSVAEQRLTKAIATGEAAAAAADAKGESAETAAEVGQDGGVGMRDPRRPWFPLVLAHPPDPVARVACQSLRAYLGRIGVEVELVEASYDAVRSGETPYDMWYAELAMWEPVVDARRLLGPRGRAGRSTPYMARALRKLDAARTWKEARDVLHEIHAITHRELPVIPLWQSLNSFAYRDSVTGIEPLPVELYERVWKWEHRFTLPPRIVAQSATSEASE